MQDQPTNLPTTRPDGRPLKPITQAVLERRASSHFQPDPVPEAFLGLFKGENMGKMLVRL